VFKKLNWCGYPAYGEKRLRTDQKEPVILSVKTVSCHKTVLRQLFDVLVLVLRVSVLVSVRPIYSHRYEGMCFPKMSWLDSFTKLQIGLRLGF